ncbi:MAG: hypothetical protein H6Q70_116 [Firmicutes bacterium]|nr:hypothetical protein [Bacillota bacterium]
MQIDLKTNKKARYIFYVVGISLCVFIISYVYITFIAPTPPVPVQKPSVAQSQSKKVVSSMNNTDNDISKINPFIELSEIKAGNSVQGNSNPAPVVASGNAGLPQIPGSFTRPNIGSVQLPLISSNNMVASGFPTLPASTAPQSVQQQSQIKGVLTGSNGNNIAIMADGKIISEGDTYQDGRIEQIGGDGIAFTDGHTISYK